mgnify:CR=1 FL=1
MKEQAGKIIDFVRETEQLPGCTILEANLS